MNTNNREYIAAGDLSNKTPQDTRVMVGISGGVDSSVSALLLKQQGYQVEGLFMKNWEEDNGTEYCTAKQDLTDAQAVCDEINIKLHTANFAAEYWDNVFEHFLQEYAAGRTPNPDILCNKEIKFKAFLEYARLLGADLIATGHYARLDKSEYKTRLLKGLDHNKDQSYFLHQVGWQQLRNSLFPIGELNKPQVRQIAADNQLITHDKKDSTGICFIGERRFKDFLQRYIPAQPGNIETLSGDVLGQHSGLMYHTIGQRQGLQIGGKKAYSEAPWYVFQKDLNRNILLVCQNNDNPALYKKKLYCGHIHWISTVPAQYPMSCKAKIRYRQEDQDCYIKPVDNDHYEVLFTDPQRAITPGQSIVFYQEDNCLGGGIIQSTE